MSLLDELGLTDQPGLMLIAPPDDVLAEAGRLSPRPSIAPSLRHAEPSGCIAWWPQREQLTAEGLSRVHWMVATGQGVAWLIGDPRDDQPLSASDLKQALDGTNLSATDERRLSDGSAAVRCVPG